MDIISIWKEGQTSPKIGLGGSLTIACRSVKPVDTVLQRALNDSHLQCVIVAGDLVLRTYEGIEVGAMATSGWIAVESQRTLFRLQVDRGRQCVFSDFCRARRRSGFVEFFLDQSLINLLATQMAKALDQGVELR